MADEHGGRACGALRAWGALRQWAPLSPANPACVDTTSAPTSRQAILDLDPGRRTAWFAVFDGHGGKEVAKFCALRLHRVFAEHPGFSRGALAVPDALKAAFLAMDDAIRSDPGRRVLQALAEEGLQQGSGDGSLAAGSGGDDSMAAGGAASRSGGGPRSQLENVLLYGDGGDDDDGFLAGRPGDGDDCSAGCTSVVAVLLGGTLYVANAGDSRAVLCRKGGEGHDMSVDHKPTLEGEKARILAAGGFVADGRVKGSLALSRAIGDIGFKQTPGIGPEAQMVTALPEVRVEQLLPGDEFLVLACDGIWDVMTSQQVVDFVRERLGLGHAPSAVCAALCDACMAPNTGGMGLGCDNMSVVLCVFKPAALPPAT